MNVLRVALKYRPHTTSQFQGEKIPFMHKNARFWYVKLLTFASAFEVRKSLQKMAILYVYGFHIFCIFHCCLCLSKIDLTNHYYIFKTKSELHL